MRWYVGHLVVKLYIAIDELIIFLLSYMTYKIERITQITPNTIINISKVYRQNADHRKIKNTYAVRKLEVRFVSVA